MRIPYNTSRHRQLEQEPTPTPAALFDDVAFALLLVSAAAIVDTMLALVVVI